MSEVSIDIEGLCKSLREKRHTFCELCQKELVGATGVRAYAREVIEVFSHALRGVNIKKFSIVACGGLGRGEISFDSDLDLLFLYRSRLSTKEKTLIESLVSALWDSGFEVGQQVHSPGRLFALAKEDFSVCTTFLETTFLGGDRNFYLKWRRDYLKKIRSSRHKKRFFYSLKEHREMRMKNFGESIYLIEPHIKEGIGGMRDLHCIKWGAIVFLETEKLENVMGLGWLNQEELRWIEDGYDFLWRTRIQLHRIGGNKKDQLSVEDQRQLAQWFGLEGSEHICAEESFMRLYYTHTSRIKRVTGFFMEKIEEKFYPRRRRKKAKIIPGPFIVDGKHIHFKDPEDVKIRPELLMDLFWNGARLGLHFHHETGRIVRENLALVPEFSHTEEAVQKFFDILLNPTTSFDTLKTMHETKFLEAFIPEFAPLRYRTQYDTYHIYTVDEHLLRTVKEMHSLKEGEYGSLFEKDIDEKVLFLSALLHDIGKGRGKGHALRGAKMVKEMGKRFFLATDEIELLSFLVENHLLLAEIALKRDLEDEKPVEMCVSKVGSLKKLYMLFLLTIADSMATGPRVWNSWRKSLLEELFIRVENFLKQKEFMGEELSLEVDNKKQQVISLAGEDKGEIEKWLEDVSLKYLLSNSPEDIYFHFSLEKKLSTKEVVLEVRPLSSGLWEFVIVCKDHPRLFDYITGVLWVNGINVLSADIYTRRYGVAVDIIKVENIPDPFRIEEFCKRIEGQIQALISGEISLEELYKNIPSYSKLNSYPVIRKKDKVVIDEDASDFYTVIEVYTWERPGVLHIISKVLHEFDLSIKLAKITTPGAQVVDVFYVTDRNGSKIMDEELNNKLEKALLRALRELG